MFEIIKVNARPQQTLIDLQSESLVALSKQEAVDTEPWMSSSFMSQCGFSVLSHYNWMTCSLTTKNLNSLSLVTSSGWVANHCKKKKRVHLKLFLNFSASSKIHQIFCYWLTVNTVTHIRVSPVLESSLQPPDRRSRNMYSTHSCIVRVNVGKL